MKIIIKNLWIILLFSMIGCGSGFHASNGGDDNTTTPTPSGSKVKVPVFSLSTGTYAKGQTLSIKPGEGAGTVIVTTGSTTPDKNSGIGSGKFTTQLNTSITYNAITILNGVASAMTSETFTIADNNTDLTKPAPLMMDGSMIVGQQIANSTDCRYFTFTPVYGKSYFLRVFNSPSVNDRAQDLDTVLTVYYEATMSNEISDGHNDDAAPFRTSGLYINTTPYPRIATYYAKVCTFNHASTGAFSIAAYDLSTAIPLEYNVAYTNTMADKSTVQLYSFKATTVSNYFVTLSTNSANTGFDQLAYLPALGQFTGNLVNINPSSAPGFIGSINAGNTITIVIEADYASSVSNDPYTIKITK